MQNEKYQGHVQEMFDQMKEMMKKCTHQFAKIWYDLGLKVIWSRPIKLKILLSTKMNQGKWIYQDRVKCCNKVTNDLNKKQEFDKRLLKRKLNKQHFCILNVQYSVNICFGRKFEGPPPSECFWQLP